MARRPVLEIQCDRCSKIETQEMHPSAGETKHVEELVVSFQGEEVHYSDLCTRCMGACKNYFLSMTKQNDEKDSAAATPAPEDEKGSGFLGLGGKKAS
jgi:hypothetical protein